MRLIVVIVAASIACGAPPAAHETPPATDAPIAAAPEQLAAPAAAPVPAQLPAIVARVNGEAIEGWEVEAALREITLSNLHPIPQAERDELVRSILDRIIGHHLAAQLARTRKLTVSEAAVDAEVARMRDEFANDRAFEEMLATFRLTRDQLRQQRRQSLEIANLVRVAIAPSVSVSPADVDAYYRENAERLVRPLEEVRGDIVTLLTERAQQERLAALIKEARQAAKIEILI